VIGVEQLRPLDHDTACPLRIVLASKVQEVSTVSGLQRLDLARGDGSLPGELPDGIEKPVSGVRPCVFDLDQGLVDEPSEAVQHVLAGKPPVRADVLG